MIIPVYETANIPDIMCHIRETLPYIVQIDYNSELYIDVDYCGVAGIANISKFKEWAKNRIKGTWTVTYSPGIIFHFSDINDALIMKLRW